MAQQVPQAGGEGGQPPGYPLRLPLSERLHLVEQLEEVDRYLYAAANNYLPVMPPDVCAGRSGFGAAGATSAPLQMSLARPPPLSDLPGSKTRLQVGILQ